MPPRFLRNLTLFSLLVCALAGTPASAHPGSGIVVDKYGQVFFTDTGQGIWKIDLHGKLIFLPASLFHWLTIDEFGYFSNCPKNFGSWFERVTPQATKPALIMCSDFPLTVNRDGNIYYARTRENSAGIVRRTPDGEESLLVGSKMFQHINGIAAAPDGSLFVTDGSSTDVTTIRKITMDGVVSTIATFAGKTGDNVLSSETGPSYCRGLVIDSQRVIYVAATGSRSVIKISAEGKVSTVLQEQSPWSPTAVTVFKGELYVLEWHDVEVSRQEERRAWIPRVRKVGRDGQITTLATVSRK